jgi:hypothetical protein
VSALLLVAAAIYGIIPPIVDLGESHTFHPAWPPHARFHMVWLLGTNSTLAAIVAWLVLTGTVEQRETRLRFASLLGIAALGGFFVATLTQSAYGGALHDPTAEVSLILGLDGNLVAFTPALVIQLVAAWLAHRKSG